MEFPDAHIYINVFYYSDCEGVFCTSLDRQARNMNKFPPRVQRSTEWVLDQVQK